MHYGGGLREWWTWRQDGSNRYVADGFGNSRFKKFDGRRDCGKYFVGSRQMFWLNAWQSVDLLLKYVDA